MTEAKTEDAPSIPTVNLTDLMSHDAAARERGAEAIREGFGTYGLVYVDEHGVDLELRDRLYRHFTALTERPEQEKQALGGAKVWYQRGWTPPNTEKAVVAGGQPDFKECYFAAPIPTDPECQVQYPEVYADNIWPEGGEDFREDYLALGHQLHEAGLSLLQGVAAALGLAARTFDRRLEGAPHVFRLLRYLPLEEEHIANKVVWGEEHTDFNLLTLLPGGCFLDPAGERCERPDDASGLYLRTRPSKEHPRGLKVRGVAPPGCIVAQVGQQLEILTGGRLLATPHVITAPATPGFSRLSAAHFLHLHSHQMLFPLEPFRDEDSLRAYSPPVLAGTYGIKTLVDIGLAPSSALDHLGYRQYHRLADIRRAETSS